MVGVCHSLIGREGSPSYLLASIIDKIGKLIYNNIILYGIPPYLLASFIIDSQKINL